MIEQESTEITDTSTTMTDRHRTFSPDKLEVRKSTIHPESIKATCGSLEIIPILPADNSRHVRYRVLIDGKEVSAKRISLTICVEELTTAELVWMPERSEWTGEK